MNVIVATFKRCKLVVGGSAMALKILDDDPASAANFCITCNLSIHGFFSRESTWWHLSVKELSFHINDIDSKNRHYSRLRSTDIRYRTQALIKELWTSQIPPSFPQMGDTSVRETSHTMSSKIWTGLFSFLLFAHRDKIAFIGSLPNNSLKKPVL